MPIARKPRLITFNSSTVGNNYNARVSTLVDTRAL